LKSSTSRLYSLQIFSFLSCGAISLHWEKLLSFSCAAIQSEDKTLFSLVCGASKQEQEGLAFSFLGLARERGGESIRENLRKPSPVEKQLIKKRDPSVNSATPHG
jgi:hypothetical protein